MVNKKFIIVPGCCIKNTIAGMVILMEYISSILKMETNCVNNIFYTEIKWEGNFTYTLKIKNIISFNASHLKKNCLSNVSNECLLLMK